MTNPTQPNPTQQEATMTTDKQFNNQVCEVVRAAGYLQDAGFFCSLLYVTAGVTDDPIDHHAPAVSVAVWRSFADSENEVPPLIAETVSQLCEQSLAGVARQMEALIP